MAAFPTGLLGLVILLASTARGAEDDSANSFLNPFPDGDIYQLTVVGDGYADGLLAGLSESMGSDTRLGIQAKVRRLNGVMGADIDSRVRDLESALSGMTLNIAIVMVGADDRVPLRSQSTGRRVPIGSDEWMAEYARRVDLFMKAIKRANLGVYWVGLPNLSRGDANEHAQKMNDVIRERAYLNGYKYIDAFSGFADENGVYSAYGPDLQGKIRVLRQGDGFTEAGNRKLAHFVEKELRRDLNRAKANKTVPLLGSEAEQAKVNPDNAVKTPAPSSPAASSDPSAVKSATTDSAPSAASADTTSDQKAENGKVSFKALGPDGREETHSVEIVRPAIPASVVALMARREGAGQFGDLIVEQMPGGLTLMSSITPSGAKSRGKQAPTQAPYFRLLVKGERLTPKPGRADDVSWPSDEKATRALGREPAPKG
ncbi:MAG: SGNH/GDSL hydrolase family protein [Hyphomicrobium sp.]